MVDGFLRVGTLQRLKARGCLVAASEDHSIAVFYHSGKIHAVHNRCPHVGYPLETGTIDGDIITCIWHQASFELSTGSSQDPEIANIPTFQVTVVDDEVWVDPTPCLSSDASD